MTAFDTYILVVSITVIVALTAFLSIVIWYIHVLTRRLIDGGYWDLEIMEEYANPKRYAFINKAGKIASQIFCTLLTVFLLVCIILGATEGTVEGSLPTLKVIKSESMSMKFPKNEYLVDNDLNDQVQMFDIIVSEPPPAESEIELYDVIIYELNGDLIIHRVVYIYEPLDGGTEGRLFYTRGDAVYANDPLPVEYSQIRGIYRGERIPFVGSFIMFMQSPAGIICILLTIFCMIIMPIADEKLESARIERRRRVLTGVATYRYYDRMY